MVKLKLVSDHAKEQAIKEEQAEATQNLTLATNHLVEYGFFYFYISILRHEFTNQFFQDFRIQVCNPLFLQ